MIQEPWFHQHIIALGIAAFILINATTALPTPRNGNQVYKWLFTFAHLTFGGLPRLIIALFPASAISKLLIGNQNDTTQTEINKLNIAAKSNV